MGISSSQSDSRSRLRKHCRRYWLVSPKYSSSLPLALLDFPEHIHRRIVQELGERDRKSLSIVCFQFLQYCEQTFERAPRLWVSIGSSWATGGYRVITESEYLEDSKRPELLWVTELQTYRLKPPPYTKQDASSRLIRSRTRRQQAKGQEIIWLCPHVGCTFDDLVNLPETPRTNVRDTRSIACAFPKCALWARHASVSTIRDVDTRELCSIFQVYRVQCSHTHPEDLRRRLLAIAEDKLQNAMQHLQMPICRHLTLGSTALTTYFDPRRIVIIPPVQDFNWNEAAKFCFDVGSCEECELEGTYTTWGFFARPCRSDASHGGIAWLDIELALARPYMDDSGFGKDHHDCQHWIGHSLPAAAMLNFVDGWWKWAEEVVVEGFDWRARLPSDFLKANRSACINFPELLPTYEEHDWNVELAEDEQIFRTRLEPPESEPYSTWKWRDFAGFPSVRRFPLRKVNPWPLDNNSSDDF